MQDDLDDALILFILSIPVKLRRFFSGTDQ